MSCFCVGKFWIIFASGLYARKTVSGILKTSPRCEVHNLEIKILCFYQDPTPKLYVGKILCLLCKC
jgi:hypothetical protein